MILAEFFDINNNGLDIADVTGVGVFLTVAAGIFWGIAHYVVRQLDARIESKLKSYTAPIQKTANGGLSLPDVARESRWNTTITKAIAEHLGIPLPDCDEPYKISKEK